jgi:hypothetical protein
LGLRGGRIADLDPSVNLTPWISFGNWLWPSMRRQFFCAPSTKLKLKDHGKRRLCSTRSLLTGWCGAGRLQRCFQLNWFDGFLTAFNLLKPGTYSIIPTKGSAAKFPDAVHRAV